MTVVVVLKCSCCVFKEKEHVFPDFLERVLGARAILDHVDNVSTLGMIMPPNDNIEGTDVLVKVV